MTLEEMKQLRRGDIIIGYYSGTTFVVTGNYGSHVTAVNTTDVTNANSSEWEVVSKAEHATRAQR